MLLIAKHPKTLDMFYILTHRQDKTITLGPFHNGIGGIYTYEL